MGSKVDTSLNVKVKVDIGDGEPIESAIRRFKREVNKSGREYNVHGSDARLSTNIVLTARYRLNFSLLLLLPPPSAHTTHKDLMELRHKRYFENPQEKKKRKVKEARMRKKFERMQRRRTRMQETA